MCPSNIGLPRDTFEVPRTGPLGPSAIPRPDTGYRFLEARVSSGGQYLQLEAKTASGTTYYLLEGRIS